LGFTADSIIGLGADYANMYGRYIKVFKNRNRGVHYAAPLEGFMLGEPEEEELVIKTQIFTTAPRPEEEYLQPNKGRIREQKMMTAEAMRLDGFSYARIANELEVPEVSVRRWVSGIKRKEVYKGDEVSPAFRGNEDEEDEPVEEQINAVPDFEKGTDAEIDEFAFNEKLIEREKRE
jgi:hypothetical protein